jgi:hypothetical protein
MLCECHQQLLLDLCCSACKQAACCLICMQAVLAFLTYLPSSSRSPSSMLDTSLLLYIS